MAGGSAIPFLVGYFVHAGAGVGGNRVPWPMESRTRLLAESSYYFVALLVAIAAAAALVWKLPSDIDAGWIFLIQVGCGVAAILVLVVAAQMRDTSDGSLRVRGRSLPNAAGEFLGLFLIWLPVVGWTYIVRVIVENWVSDSAESDPLSIALPLAVLFLTPLALLTFSCTAQCWGILFAYHRYSYPHINLTLASGDAVSGRLVRQDAQDVWIVEGSNIRIIRRELVYRMEVQLSKEA